MLLSLLADGGVFTRIKSEFSNQILEIVKVGARWSVVAILGDARGQLDYYLVFINSLFCFDLANEVAEFAVQRATATSATCQVKRPVCLVR